MACGTTHFSAQPDFGLSSKRPGAGFSGIRTTTKLRVPLLTDSNKMKTRSEGSHLVPALDHLPQSQSKLERPGPALLHQQAIRTAEPQAVVAPDLTATLWPTAVAGAEIAELQARGLGRHLREKFLRPAVCTPEAAQHVRP